MLLKKLQEIMYGAAGLGFFKLFHATCGVVILISVIVTLIWPHMMG